MTDATFTFRVDAKLKKQFASAASARDRSGAQPLRDFMREVVKQEHYGMAQDAWFREQVGVGLDAANAGEVVFNDEVDAEAATWRAEIRRKLADLTA